MFFEYVFFRTGHLNIRCRNMRFVQMKCWIVSVDSSYRVSKNGLLSEKFKKRNLKRGINKEIYVAVAINPLQDYD